MSQEHHISYDPEVTIDILKELHEEFHGHGTGKGKGEKNRGYPRYFNHLGVEETIYAFRLRTNLLNLAKTFVEKSGFYLNLSDFVRSAIREKIRRDSPQLIRTLFEEMEEVISEGSEG